MVGSARLNLINGINKANVKSILRWGLYYFSQFRMIRDIYEEGVSTGILFNIENKELLKEIQKHNAIMMARQEWVEKGLYFFKAADDRAIAFKFARGWTNKKYDMNNSNNAMYDTIIEQNSWLLDNKSEEFKLAFISVTKFDYFLLSRSGQFLSEIEGSLKLISLINKELEK